MPTSKAPPTPPGSDQTPGPDAPWTQGFDQLRRKDFTDLAWSILELSRRLGGNRAQPGSTGRMLAAVVYSGLYDTGDHTGVWLVSQLDDQEVLQKRLAARYPAIARLQGPIFAAEKFGGPMSSRITAHLMEIVERARRLAAETAPPGRSAQVGARHLLGAALARTDPRQTGDLFLRNFGSDADRIRTRLLHDLQHWKVDDNLEVWHRLVEGETGGIPVYAADSLEGEDRIGILREVEALAALVSAWAIEPPLSIGLFGEWGSGKSFFMRKMQRRVSANAAEARASQQSQREFGYYKNIVQIEFNAWHYVEGNLWASLVEHIFSNLRLNVAGEDGVDSEAQVRQRLERLLGEVKEKSADVEQKSAALEQAKADAEQKRQAAETKAQQLDAEAKGARQRAIEAEAAGLEAAKQAAEKQKLADLALAERDSFTFKDVVEEVTASVDIRKQAQADLQVFGITPERVATVQGLRNALQEASDGGTVILQGLKGLREDKHRWWLLLWVAAVPAGVALLVWLTKQQAQPWVQAIAGPVSVIGTGLGVLLGAWKRYSPKLKPVLEAAKRLKEKHAALEQQVEQARQARAARAAELDHTARQHREKAAAQRAAAETKTAEAEAVRQEAKRKQEEAEHAAQAVQLAQAELTRLRAEAEALRPERRIAAFIQERAQATDYRSLLGVPALIRRDFEKLSAMFRTRREAEKQGLDAEQNDLAVVNRIILYIDDLDRCPPEKVVEVLRAIHLLLAFPLFVVVVAVDARWMKRSLRDRFELLLAPHETNGTDRPPGAPQEEALQLGPMATPDDYLEKIFQIPFWIRPLSRNACKSLVSALTQDELEAGSQTTQSTRRVGQSTSDEPGATAAPGSPGTAGPADSAGPAGVSPASQQSRFQWREVEPQPRALQITADERAYMLELAPVIGRSPRALKRFVNCYRVLKAALDQEELAKVTRDGTFRTLMFLLGVATGLPDLAPTLLAELRRSDRQTTPSVWAQETAVKLEAVARQRWEGLAPAIAKLEQSSDVRTIAPLIEAADLVDRFSFSPMRIPHRNGSKP